MVSHLQSLKNSHHAPALLQPLSLQQSSINCIVTNLEKYPPDLLALLPLHFRRELLLLLPPADIFQLEQTKFIEGIDMENEIWKMVSERFNDDIARTAHFGGNIRFNPHGAIRLRHLYSFEGLTPLSWACGKIPLPISWKKNFVSCLVSFLFYVTPIQLTTVQAEVPDRYASHHRSHRNYIVLLQFLFCNQFFNLKQLTDVGGFPLQVSEMTLRLLPSRYSRFFTSLVPLSEWVRFLLEDCHIEPPYTIKIDLDQFNDEFVTSLQHFFSNAKGIHIFVKFIALSLHQQTGEENRIARLCRLLTACHQLDNIRIVQNHVDRHASRGMFDHSQLNKILQVCFSHRPQFVKDIDSKLHSGLFRGPGLKHIDITSYRTEIDLSTLYSLFVFTQNHGFESISVCGLTVKCDDQQREIQNDTPISSSCCLISLNHVKQIPFSFLFWLMKLFLYSPSTITQKMVVSSCEIDYSVVPSERELKSIPESPDLANSHKCLYFSRVALKHVFVETLTHLPSFVLDELYIYHNSGVYKHHLESRIVTIKVLSCLFLTLPTVPTCRIKSLSVELNNVHVLFNSKTSNDEESFVLDQDHNSCISNFIAALFQLAQKLPETAVSLFCGVSSEKVGALLACLHNEWKKRGGNVLLDQLHIPLSGFISLLEENLMKYPVHDIARNVNVGQKGSE